MQFRAGIDRELEQHSVGDGSASASPERARRIDAVMQNIEIFRVFKQAKRRYLAAAMSMMEIGPGEPIVEEGEDGDAFYIIEQGQVRITKKDENGDAQPLVELNAGQHFGELALIEDAPRAATVTAIGDVALLVLSRDDFHGIIGPLKKMIQWSTYKTESRKREAERRELAVGLSLKERMSTLSDSVDHSQSDDMSSHNDGALREVAGLRRVGACPAHMTFHAMTLSRVCARSCVALTMLPMLPVCLVPFRYCSSHASSARRGQCVLSHWCLLCFLPGSN